MIETINKRLYTTLPAPIQTVAQKWFYLLNPRLSWTYRKKHDTVDDAFVERFFDDRAEYERYRDEFFDSAITDICLDAQSEVPDRYSVFDAHRNDCLKFYVLIRKLAPDRVVETGVYNGVSTASILLALAANGSGHLHSIDYSASLAGPDEPGLAPRQEYYRRDRPSCSETGSAIVPPDRSPGWILPDRLRDRWSLTRGHPQRELPGLLESVGPIDMFVHDSEHSTSCMLFELEALWDHLRSGGLVLSSHIRWNDAFEIFAEEHDCEHGLTTFHYLGYEGKSVPCSTGYIWKP